MNLCPREIGQMLDLIGHIRDCSPVLERHEIHGVPIYLELLDSSLRVGAWSWRPVLARMPPNKINRCGNVLNGPLYACNGYEWPMHNDLPMVPLVQLDLKRCSTVAGLDLGSGLLQVWYGAGLFKPEDALIRVIPPEKVQKIALLPIPKFDVDAFEKPMASIDWAEYDKHDKAKNSDHFFGTQISRFEKARYTLPNIGVARRDSSFKEIISSLSSEASLSKECLCMMIKLDEMLYEAEKIYSAGTHLMGTFDTIQYSAKDVPIPLFCFDDGDDPGCYNFGDGNAQVCFARSASGMISYSFHWSCF